MSDERNRIAHAPSAWRAEQGSGSNERRRFVLATAAAGCVVIQGAGSAAAATWPDRPVNVLVGYSAGGSLDQMVRSVADHASGALGQRFVVENRTGASGTVAAAAVVHAAPDGYTFLAGGDPELLLAPRTMRLSYDPAVDLDPLCVAAVVPIVLAIHADRPERSITELIASARREPLSCAVPGARTPMSLAAAMMNRELGTRIEPVAYQGGSAVARDLAGGQVPIGMTSPLSLTPMVKAGRVRVLAVLQRERARLLPEVPAIGEVGMRSFEAQALNVFSARTAVPEPIRLRFAAAVRDALGSAPIAERLRAAGVDPVALTPDESRRLIARLGEQFDVAVKTAGWTRE
jgi:tripartite-type tricarboxylate transporter receptor subunit TctC